MTVIEEFLNHIIEHKKKNGLDVEQTTYRFDNGYGANVIKEYRGPGVELAVIQFYDDESNAWGLEYSTDITNDVLRHLNDVQLRETLQMIKDL
ncbi:hypothetical protein [Listeria seeligeri]|uniref:hypothetical protein n=1 Tax=Listeria seeligeri TaxID=1640 RepID=UPI001888A33B|nr:hypothetical protein [Listeria seeligeri]MBF2653925.1 hypothetical protein [Listeria seeligeri]